VGFVLFIFLVFYVVLLCVFTFWVLWCGVRYDFCITTMKTCVMSGHRYAQANTINVNKTWAHLQTTGCKDEGIINISMFVFWWGSCCSSIWFFMLSYYVSLLSDYSFGIFKLCKGSPNDHSCTQRLLPTLVLDLYMNAH
jgi:hypothetical protein